MHTTAIVAGSAFLLLLLASNVIRRIFLRHLRARGAEATTSDTAAWLLFFGLAFLGGAVLGVLNLSKFLNLAFCSTLLVFGLAALVGALVMARR